MNKLLVITKNSQLYFNKRLSEEVGEDKVFFYDPWKDPLPGKHQIILNRTSGILGPRLDFEFLKKQEALIINPLEVLKLLASKSSQYRFFRANGYPCLPWNTLGEEDHQTWKIKTYLVKPDIGQGGWGIKVLGKDELRLWIEERTGLNDRSWLIQPYIEAPEYRIFFIDDFKLALKRFPSPNNVAANFNQAGEAFLVSVPKAMEELVDRLRKDSKALYGAVDIFDYEGSPVLLDFNSVPGIEQLEALSGLNIMKLFLAAKFFGQIL